MTSQEFYTGWKVIKEAFPVDRVTDETGEIYFQTLSPMPSKLWIKAVNHVLMSHKYHTFPPIAVFIEVLENDEASRALNYTRTPEQRLALYKQKAAKAIEGNNQKQLPGKRRDEEITRLKEQIDKQAALIVNLRQELHEAKKYPQKIEERKALLRRQLKRIEAGEVA